MTKLNKSTLMLILTLYTLSNAQAFNDAVSSNDIKAETKQIIDKSIISDWGDSALTFTVFKEDYDLEALGFSLSSKNITSLNTSHDTANKTQKIASLFQNDHFSAQSGIGYKITDHTEQQTFFLQGSYRFLQQEKFTLLLTAKIESLSEQSIYQFYSNDLVYREEVLTADKNRKSYTRIGVLGQYSITNHWYLVGGVTSTTHEDSVNNQLKLHKKTEKIALFGTTYTF